MGGTVLLMFNVSDKITPSVGTGREEFYPQCQLQPDKTGHWEEWDI